MPSGRRPARDGVTTPSPATTSSSSRSSAGRSSSWHTCGVGRCGWRSATGSGEVLGECGNSGNSTEPHVHVQVSDCRDWDRAKGVPLAFRLADGVRVPEEGEVVGQ